ncbi:DUF1883 domain-containing protein [Sorangium sp. So ce117]|uniref:DUF1883 domain-containing protein n=1 Tax=Sorangium sp. So ce117 TaxID=3133277 RepID=UPI003F5DC45B
MNFLHSEVNTGPGDAIAVTLEGNAANVLVMDSQNFQNYRRGASFRHYGGHSTRPQVIIRPPSGHWHVVVDLGGRRGHVRAGVQVVQG